MNDTELAIQQMIGYRAAQSGESISRLAESMGLTKREWNEIKDTSPLTPTDTDELNIYFKEPSL